MEAQVISEWIHMSAMSGGFYGKSTIRCENPLQMLQFLLSSLLSYLKFSLSFASYTLPIKAAIIFFK